MFQHSSYFFWSNSTTSDSTIVLMKPTAPCAITYSSVEKVVPSEIVISWMGWKLKAYCKIFLNQWKITTQNFNYKREMTLKLRSSLCLRLGSLRRGEKWILFSVELVNINTLREIFSLDHRWSNTAPIQWNLKRLRQKLELNKLIEGFNFLWVFLSWKILTPFHNSFSYL